MNNQLRKALCCFASSLALSSSGCATTPSPAAARIQPADQSTVVGCTFVGDVSGSSGWGNIAASQGMQNAKNEGLEQASAMGATHVVWVNIAGGYSPYANGKAYRCN
ncbi:MAG: DUF4156 domain-containing protein [Nitrososphaera sp.]|nr:DUF4156 domain-containing protein [Nitrososphaera sp.]